MPSVENTHVSRVVVLFVGGVLVWGLPGADRAVRAQPTVRSASIQMVPQGARLSGTAGRMDSPDPHPGRIVLGSALGAVGGVGLGAALLRWAAVMDREQEDRVYDDPSRADPAAGIALLGAAVIVGGAPFGAVRMGRIENGRTGAYVLAGVGEFVVGALGYALANRLHESPSSRLVGLGTGVVVGAAGGALVAPTQEEQSTGLVGYEAGEWRVSPPDVRVHPNVEGRQPPSATVALLSLRW